MRVSIKLSYRADIKTVDKMSLKSSRMLINNCKLKHYSKSSSVILQKRIELQFYPKVKKCEPLTLHFVFQIQM